jgi:NAD(P)-dependent dehydrogenase (short-subunit alcohol dehydrogenase family)/acyl carrier protein
LLSSVLALIDSGALSALPYRVFQRRDVLEAFRLMQSGGHVGKLVIAPDRAAAAPAPAPRPFVVSPQRAYVVTGGLSGFGLETARWLIAQGAERVALLGRRGGEAASAAIAAALAQAGADVRAYEADVADATALEAALQRIRSDLGPIGGVYHAAAVIEDGLLQGVCVKALQRVLGAKLQGAINLDRLTRQDPVEQFVLFSSATTLLGAPGQGAYVAANCGLEALARRRCAEGLPSLAVGWGPIADVGVLAQDAEAREQLSRRLSATPFTAAEALAALPVLWQSGAPVLGYAAVRWDRIRKTLTLLNSPTFSGIAQGGAASEELDLSERLSGLSPDAAKAVVRDLLVEEMSKILSCSPERLDVRRPLPELGMDSLMAVELRMILESRLRISLPLLSLSDSTTITNLASRIVKTAVGAEGGGEEGVDSDLLEAAIRHENADADADVELGGAASSPARNVA